MNYAAALRKIGALLKLAASDNVNEAAAATAKAQRLMREYRVTTAEAELEGAPRADEEIVGPPDPLDAVRGNVPRWRSYLALTIAEVNQCRIYLSTGIGLKIVGHESDVQTVRYLFAYFTAEVDRLAKRECKGCGRTYKNNFRLGCVDTLKQKMSKDRDEHEQEMRQARGGVANERALVRIEQTLAHVAKRQTSVDKWVKRNLRLAQGSRSQATFNPSARTHGQQAARSIASNRAKGALVGGA